MINIIFMRCLSAHMNSESNFNFILLRPPQSAGAEPKTKQNKSEVKKEEKNSMFEILLVFGCTHAWIHAVVSVCARSTCIFCRFIFHKHIAFLGAAFYEFIGAAS